MLADYTEERGLIKGVKDTFDGQHACSMCKRIAKDKSTEDQQQLPVTKGEKENLAKWFGLASESVAPAPRWREFHGLPQHAAPLLYVPTWDAAPPVPPPELVA